MIDERTKLSSTEKEANLESTREKIGGRGLEPKKVGCILEVFPTEAANEDKVYYKHLTLSTILWR